MPPRTTVNTVRVIFCDVPLGTTTSLMADMNVESAAPIPMSPTTTRSKMAAGDDESTPMIVTRTGAP